jgi:hypothetical protein
LTCYGDDGDTLRGVLSYDIVQSGMCASTNFFLFFMKEHPLVGQSLLIIETSRSHSVRYTALGRTPLDQCSARQRPLPDIHAPGGIRTRNPSKSAAAGVGASKKNGGIKFPPSVNTHKSHYTVSQFGAVTTPGSDKEH